MATTIDITDQITPLLRTVNQRMRPGAMEKVMERALVDRVSQHLFKLNSERPNQLGGRRTNFYSQAAESVHGASQSGEVTVTISHVRFRQRLEGGVILPVNAKYLTIPARAEAYGKRAREFHNLRILWGRQGPYALVERDASRIKVGREKRDGTRTVTNLGATGGGVLFWLAKSVNQAADPTVLPTEEELADTAVRAAGTFLEQVLTKGGANV